jgi:hypothetical protein
MRAASSACVIAVLALVFSTSGWAQESRSAPLAKELAAALDASKRDSIAAKDPADSGSFVGALYFPGFELLLISGTYASPPLIDARLGKREYKDVYLELNGTIAPSSRVFIEDMGIDGLSARREDNAPFDTVEIGGTRTALDGDWRKQKMSEEDYMKAFAAADERYAQLLTALLAEAKK